MKRWKKYESSVNIGGKLFTKLRLSDDIDGLTSSELELVNVISKLDQTAKKYGMEINETKTNIIINSEGYFNSEIKTNDTPLK